MTLLQAYEDRRLELGLKKQDVAARAGVTPTHLRRALIGKVALSPDLAAALERALEWPRGQVARIRARDSPSPAPPIPDGVLIDPADWAVMTPQQRIDYEKIMRSVRKRRRDEASRTA